MMDIDKIQIVLYLILLLAFTKPLGWYMARVYGGQPCGLNQIFGRLELFFYRVCSINNKKEMNWKQYLTVMLLFNLLGFFAVYFFQRLQFYFPLNPQSFPAVPADLSFNTAMSFITNTNWQAYAGETTLSYLTQMIALTVQNFLSAATGMSLLIAFIRSLTLQESENLGNYWVDMVRSIFYILLPLAFIFAIVLATQGVIQNFKPYQKISTLESFTLQHPLQYPLQHQKDQTLAQSQKSEDFSSNQLSNNQDKHSANNQIENPNNIQNKNPSPRTQLIPMGPVASQIAIKQLGTNGGGFFNVNSAHPFENPNALTNFLEMFAILLIPAALCYTFGVLVNDKRQGWAILATMFFIFIPLMIMTIHFEQKGNPAFNRMGIDQTFASATNPGGNMEGKELRFGIDNSALWASSTTAASNGSVNAMLDSFTPLGGLIPLWLMQLGEVVFGGVGSGLYGMLMLVIITVFIAGLMVGRTPEYLGKKIEPYEMKMASIAVLIMPLIVLLFTALAMIIPAGTKHLTANDPHGFSEILYAFTSMTNNNGSAFAGLDANNPFYNILGGIAILIGRFWLAIPVLAIAGSFVRKKIIPPSSGTLPTHNLLFVIILIAVICIFGALTFFPALALGPIIEHLIWMKHYG